MRPLSEVLDEITDVKGGCMVLFDDMRRLCAADSEGHYPDTFRLMAVPMIYAVWERCFSLCHAVGLKRLREVRGKTSALASPQRALWLQRQPFYASYLDKVRRLEPPKRGTSRGEFGALCDLLRDFETWSQGDIDPSVEMIDLVMTFSNVNPEVVKINAVALGIYEHPKFQEIELGRLNDLVGRRNDIGHGGIVTPPGKREFLELWGFAEALIGSYCDAFGDWISQEMADLQR